MIDVLLVEDDKGDAMLLEDALEQTTFDNTLHHVEDGIEAQEFLEDSEKPRPSFILMDLNMPRMDGHETLQWIKSHPSYRHIPVGIMTTSSAKEDIERSYQNYASFFITKPPTFQGLQEVVEIIDDFWVKTAKLPKVG